MTPLPITRRRVLRIAAGMAGVPLMMAGVRAFVPAPGFHRWRGAVLGAVSEIVLWHTDDAFARATLFKARQEIERLENIFSLYRPASDISRLNAAGRLARPARELVTLIDESRRLSVLSAGAFDISVQPLWRLYEAHFWSRTDLQPDFLGRARDVAAAVVDFRAIDTRPYAIAFERTGMAITLNAIAQGFVTDRIADLLREEGFENAVVDLGEYRVLGRHPDGRPWRLAIQDALIQGKVDETLPLENMALAVSAPSGTTFEASGRFHHIFNPHTGLSALVLAEVAVIAPRATQADGLATALCVTGESFAPTLLRACPGSRAILTRLDGTRVTVHG